MKSRLITMQMLLIVVTTGCNSCYSMFYKNNERSTLNISIAGSRLKSSFVRFYIDSVANKGKSIPDSILYAFSSDGHLREDERIINFTIAPKEAYLVILSSTPCQIYYVYNSKYANEVIGDSHELSTNELRRIENRFNNEILQQAENFKIKHNIPDSIAYSER